MTPRTYVDRAELLARYAYPYEPRVEDSRFTVDDAKREMLRMRRAAAVERQSRKVLLTLRPGEMHPRDLIAHLTAKLTETEEARADLSAENFSLRTQLVAALGHPLDEDQE